MRDYLISEAELVAEMKTLNGAMPETSMAFAGLVKAASADGAIDHKTKELIALAIAVSLRCEGCLLFHIRALTKLGCSRDELVDALGVAIEMGGGPAKVYAAHALAIFDAMSAD